MPSPKEQLAALKDDQKPIARQPFANLRPRPPLGKRGDYFGRAFVEVLGDPPRPFNNKE